uniref:Uncharacterized LOC110947915 n=1 Tax=Acanthochromis polyacanthus TaxID=80966 RepID=A0A3Q1FBK5_9TELE
MSRRKLGSSRRNKGRQFAKDSETEPYLEHREEVEEKTRGNKTVETTQTSLTAQLDRQEESSQGSVQDISATPNSSLFSASTPDYDNSEVKSPSILNSPEDVTEILTPKPGNLQADQARENETKLEKTDKSDTPQSAEMEENVGILELSHLSALSSLSAAQKLINIQLSNSKEMPGEKLSHVYSATEMGSNKNDDTDMFRQDESLQGNTLESESQVGSVALESATDKNSHRENTAVKDNAEQAMFLLPKEELPTNEKLKELFNSELKDDQRLEDTVNNVHEQDFKTTKMQKVDQDEYSPESLILDATENADICAGNLKDQAEVRDVNQLELSGKVTDDFAPKQEVLNPDDKKDEHPIKVDNLEVDFKVVFDKSVGATLEGVDKSDTGAGHSEDDVEKVQEEEGQTTEMQEMQQIDNLSASTDDATDNSKIVEIITTLPSNVMVESIDDSATEQEVSNPDDKKNEQPTKEDNLEVLVQISEDNPSCDTKTPQTSDIERVDAALVQVSESEGRVEDDVKPNPEQTFHQEAAQLFSEMENTAFSLQSFESETNAASDSQPHDSSASIHEETNTDLQQSGIRRKLGSSRRNKGRQPVKEFKEEALENTTSDEAVKIIKMSLATSQADLSQGTEHNAVPSLLHDSSMFSVSTLGYSSEVQKPAATNHPEADLGSLISKSENLQEDRETDFKVVSDKSMGATLEGVDTSDTGAHQSEDNCKIFEIITPHSSEVMVKSTEDSATEQEVSTPTVKQDEQPTKEDNLEASDQISEDNPSYDIKTPQTSDIERADTALVQVSESEGGVEDDVKPNPEQMFHHGMEQLISEMEDSKSLQSFQSETNVVFDSQPHDRSTGTDEKTNTGFQQSDIRRKLGSSRRNKGKQQVKDNKPTEEADENAKGHEPSETTETALTSETADQENSTETMLEGMNRFDTRLTEEENTQNDTHVCTSEVITSGKHSSPTVDKQVIDLSHCTQMPDEDLLGVHSVTDTENKERDEYTDLLRLDGNLPEDPLVSKTQVSPFTVEISTEKISPGEHTELEFGAEKATDSSQKDELSTKEEQLSDVSGAQQSEVAVKKVDEQDLQPTQIQDQQQKYSSPESLIVLDATEKVDTSFGNLKDQTEMRDTNMSELSRKITDDSAPKEEVSNPVTKQDERPTQERHLEALEQGNEDSDVYDSKQPRIRNTEREDTAPGQVNEGEGQVDIDVKHKDEQIVHQDDEGVISEKSTFSPQTLLSEIDAPFDSNHQDPSVSVVEETNTGFDLRGNRRKLGSSRRKKERQQDTESKEEALENTTSDEALEITQMSLGTETGIQEDLSQEAKQDAIPSVLHDSSMFLVSSPGYSEVQKPAATSHPEPDLGSLIPINENLEEAQEDRQTDLKGMPDKSVGATLEDVDTSDTVAHQSEVNVKKMQEEEGKTTEMQQIKNLSVSAIGDATDNSKIVEIITTLPSEVKVESIDDSATEQEVSNPDDKQDEQPTKEDNLEVLVQISEDNPSCDTKTPQTSDIERVDAALVQVSESDDKVEGDVKPNPEQAFHQEAAQLFSEVEDIKFPLQSFESETNVASGSQPHDSSASIDVETNTGNTQISKMKNTSPNVTPTNRRKKMGSTRRNLGSRNKGKDQDNEETETEIIVGDVKTESVPVIKEKELQLHKENNKGDEALEITKMSLATETIIQEDLSQEAKHDVIPSVLHDSSMFLVSTPGYSEVQKPAGTSHPEADLGSLIPINENLEETQEGRETDFNVVSDKSVGATLEDVDTSDTVAHQSEINVKKMQEEEGKTTEMQQIDDLSASAIGDGTDHSKIVEIITTLPSEVMVESIDDSATEQDVSNPDDKQDEQPTKEDNLEGLDQISEDNPSYDTKTPQTSDIERVDAALVQVSESEGREEDDVKPNPEQTFHQEAAQLFSEMEDIKFPLQNFDSETNVASGSQPHDSSATIDVETNTGFQQSGIRRKLGSSRRNKGRQQFKDNKPTEEADENKIDHEPSETAKTPLTTETADQEKSAETMLEGMYKFDTHPTEEENKQLPDENLLDFYSVTDLEKGRDGAQHLEDAVKKVHDEEIKSIQKQETPQIDNISVSVIDDATNNTEILIDLTEIRDVYQSKLAVKNTDDDTKEINFESSDQGKEADRVFDTKKPQLSDTERADTALGDYVTESQVKDDIKSSAGKTGCQEAGLFSEMGDTESSLQSLQHELHAALDSKPQQNNTSFSSGGNTRKLGSSQEKSMETMLEGKDKSDSAQIKDTVHVKQNEHFGPLDGISEFSSSSLHSSLVVERQQVHSNSSEMPDKGLPIMSFVSDNKEKDENTEPLRQDGRSQCSDLFSESHVESENVESPTTMEITTEKSSSREHTKIESSVEQSLKSAPKKELASSGEQNECFNPFEVTGAEQSDDVVNKVHEELINPIQVQDLLQTDTGPKPCLQAQPSEINAPLDSKQDDPQCIKDESPTGPNPSGSRRKLGSSRRSKGRQHAKEEATESTRDDEASKTPNILATEMARQEELTDIKSPEKIRKISSTVNENDNTEKLPDKDTLSTDSSTVVTADNDFLKSNKDVDDKDKKPVKEPENLSYLTGYDTDEMDLMQPPQASVWKDDLYMQNISYHDDRSRTVDIVAQEEASQLQNTEDLLRKDADVQQTNDEIETVGHVMMESSVDKQGSGQGEVGQNFEDSTNKVGAVQEINTSHILVSTAQEPAEDVESEISTAMDASNSQEENQSDYKKNLQVKSNQRRRKLGSTRRNLLNRKQEGETDDKDETTESEVHTEANARNLDEMKDAKELVLSAEVSQNENATTLLGAVYKEQQEGYEISSAHDEGHQLESSTSSLQSSESNVIPGRDDLMALLPEPAASHTEEAVDPDRKDGERNVDIGVEPSMLEEFTSSKTQISPMIAERNRRSLDQLLPLNTDTTTNTGITGGSSVLGETTETTQNDDERAESATEIQDQDSTQQKPNIVIEEAQAKTPEMKNASPNVTPTNRRRKMGSTRRNLGSRNKGEDLDNEATETEIIVGDVKTESVPVIKEKELQLHTEHNEGDPEQERLLETTEFSQAGECQPTPPTQQTVEKKPVTQGELLDTEEHSPNYLPSTSTKNDTTSMSASGRRRRKMGSHRKSHGHQGYGDQTEEQEGILDEQNETNVRSTPEEGVIKPYEEHKEEPLDLQKTSEGDDRDRKPSSSIIISKPAEHSRPVSEKTPFQPSHAENRLGQEQFSLAGEPRGAGLRSDSYHVVMIGDSSVGKTSFMKRAQTGKFSLDIPSSIGLDSCMWTVMVDGKPVVLELWDTAGQERFRSITRHIFHRAQAFLLMYDITCTESFSAVSYWANCIQESAAEDVTILLLGNKSDCAKRQVKTEQGEILAKEYNFEFMECSAATGENVVQCLETVARMLNQKIGTREEATVVQQGAAQKKRSTCC